MRRLLKWLLPDADLRAFESEQSELHDARRVRDGDGPAARRGRRADRRRLVVRLVADRLRGSGTAATPDDGGRAGTTDRLGQIAQDLRHSARSLLRTPGLATTIVLTVGLGLGATMAMVSVIRAVVLNPLPYRDADRLVLVRTQDGDNLFNLSVADYQALDAQQTSFNGRGGQPAGLRDVMAINRRGRATTRACRDLELFPAARPDADRGRLLETVRSTRGRPGGQS